MNKSIRVLMMVVGMTASVAASAESSAPGIYLGGGYTDTNVHFNGRNDDADTGVLFARGGYQVNQNVAFEARLGTGVDDDHIYGSKVELEDIYGMYLKAGVPLQMGFYPYVLLGATHGKVKVSGSNWSESDSTNDFSYGVGVDYWFNGQVSADLEYANFYAKDGIQVSGWTFGLNYKL